MWYPHLYYHQYMTDYNREFIPDFLKDTGNLHSILKIAELGIWEVKLDTNVVSWDDRCKELFGITKENNLSYFDAVKFIHPEDVAGVTNAVNLALAGHDGGKYNAVYRTVGADDGQLRWVNFIGQAYFGSNNKAVLFAGIARDLTTLKINEELRKSEKESTASLRSILNQAPLGIALFKTRTMRLETGNDRIFEIWGKEKEASINKELIEFLPEIKDQGFIELLENVFDTGQAFHGYGSPVKLNRAGIEENVFFDFVYTPLKDFSGVVVGIIVLAVDVTNQINSRRLIEEMEITLRGAIELAELGTWSLDLSTGIFDYSPRLRKWCNLKIDEVITMEKGYSMIDELHRPLVKEAMEKAMLPGSNGVYDIEYKIYSPTSKRERIIHAQGKTVFDMHGIATKVTGTAQDITTQRHLQLALENEVQERTEELAASIEELAVINEELEESNVNLIRSNNELRQYAYVASHDLQEPLRKIRVFTDKLITQPVNEEDTKAVLTKVKNAAERMTLLIKNVLEFSTLIEKKGENEQVDLNAIVAEVVENFELLIEEKRASINYRQLPSIESNKLAIRQLFQNLLSNSLKFSGEQETHINIDSTVINDSEASQFITKPITGAIYYRIRFTDNGIGFESEYAEQVFEIFQRLHVKEKYEGSGIGLALCKKIVSNHQGHLSVESEPGKGTTFTIILPNKQK